MYNIWENGNLEWSAKFWARTGRKDR